MTFDTQTNIDPLIQLETVNKVFFAEEVETHALSAVTMEVRRGEFVAIAGPSGCGKSTLLSILGLLDTPTGGEHQLKGDPVEDLSASQRARVRNREIGSVPFAARQHWYCGRDARAQGRTTKFTSIHFDSPFCVYLS